MSEPGVVLRAAPLSLLPAVRSPSHLYYTKFKRGQNNAAVGQTVLLLFEPTVSVQSSCSTAPAHCATLV